ncbi:MAG: THUMP domain-containing protein [Betaproteobacteria bacterium]|jgi:putative N6-adenine-specific DNA methylase|nr:THUMP domain-containing protein [Betaproteobacteria bacterium]
MEQFFATCPRGLEGVLGEELTALGAQDVRPVDGGTGFRGPYALCYRINLESRIASRVLWRIGHCRYRDENDIYAAARKLQWTQWFSSNETIRVETAAIKSPLQSLDFVTLRVKDAVCDVLREAEGKRPDVDTRAPDVRIHLFLTADEAVFYLDTSGDPLFKRGWRSATGEAPLRENLAAGILKLAGWTPEQTLLDPMCGSGTFLIEATLMALKRAPGMNRRFGFEKLRNFDHKAWETLRTQVVTQENKSIKSISYGYDRSGDAIAQARQNVAALGLEPYIELKQCSFEDSKPPTPTGVLITNPPYGVRLEELEVLAAWYPKLGDILKQRYSGWTAYILTADLRIAKIMRLKPSRRTPLFNGALECRLFKYELVAGSMRKVKEES